MEYQKTPVWLAYCRDNSGQEQFLFFEKKNEQLMKAALETEDKEMQLLGFRQLSSETKNLARILRNNEDFLAHLEILLMGIIEGNSNPDANSFLYEKETFGRTLADLLEDKNLNDKIVDELNILIQICLDFQTKEE